MVKRQARAMSLIIREKEKPLSLALQIGDQVTAWRRRKGYVSPAQGWRLRALTL